ncbi:MAG: ClpXP protease specificity-enhancing factor [Xanthomonadaceae bacterium]|jgi:stringent starvation protein B|nr:ClpXP protease specificity-enhancing factor [Xanthomonadaceae bacterium]
MTNESLPQMTSYRPYLLRALVEWINDNGMTPHILVDATKPGVQVPSSAVRDGAVVLNIADRAVVGLLIDNEWINFTARFGGVSYPVQVPMSAILAVYSRETGRGMPLPEDQTRSEPESPTDDAPPPVEPAPETTSDDDRPRPGGGKRPHLRVVK